MFCITHTIISKLFLKAIILPVYLSQKEEKTASLPMLPLSVNWCPVILPRDHPSTTVSFWSWGGIHGTFVTVVGIGLTWFYHTPCHHDSPAMGIGLNQSQRDVTWGYLLILLGFIIPLGPLHSNISETNCTLDLPSSRAMDSFLQCNQFAFIFHYLQSKIM